MSMLQFRLFSNNEGSRSDKMAVYRLSKKMSSGKALAMAW
jgi:hypothetical protein